MKTRLISAIIALPIVITLIYLGGPVLYVAIFLAYCIGLYEFNRAFKVNSQYLYGLQLMSSLFLLGLMWLEFEKFYFTPAIFFLMFMFVFYVVKYPKLQLNQMFYALIGFSYIPVMLSHILLVRQLEQYGGIMVWLIFIISFGSDSFAYFVGRTLGQHKLAKELSPNKTVEGALGGVFGAAFLSFLYALYVGSTRLDLEVKHYIGFAIMGAIGSIFSQFGDMSASAMKRVTGIKDFGNFMPGHGGIVDRMDSLIFVAPFVYYSLLFILKGF